MPASGHPRCRQSLLPSWRTSVISEGSRLCSACKCTHRPFSCFWATPSLSARMKCPPTWCAAAYSPARQGLVCRGEHNVIRATVKEELMLYSADRTVS